jgi:hypothetical protein
VRVPPGDFPLDLLRIGVRDPDDRQVRLGAKRAGEDFLEDALDFGDEDADGRQAGSL